MPIALLDARSSRMLRRALHTSASRAAALPALSNEAPKRSGLLASLLGGSGPAMPPMTEPLAGVAVPPYTAPTKPAVTAQKKLANGAIIAAEDTPVRAGAQPLRRCRRCRAQPTRLHAARLRQRADRQLRCAADAFRPLP